MKLELGLDSRKTLHRKLMKDLIAWQEIHIKVGDTAWVLWGGDIGDPQVLKVKIKRVGRPPDGRIRRVEIELAPKDAWMGNGALVYDVSGIMPFKAWAKLTLHHYEHRKAMRELEGQSA